MQKCKLRQLLGLVALVESTTGRTGLRSWQAYCPPGQAGPRHSAKLNNNNRKEGTSSPGDGQQAI